MLPQATTGDDTLYGRRLVDTTLDGLAGNDTLFGHEANETLIGNTGNDTAFGYDGDDIYHFDLGWGSDVIINDDQNTTSVDTIRFGAGIVAADITFSQSPNNLYLTHTNGDVIQVSLYYFSEASKIDRVEFADGTVLDQATIESLANGGNP